MNGHDPSRLPAVAPQRGAAMRPTSPTIHRSVTAKLSDRHLDRLAVVYVRQSSPQQIFDHKESR
jgi:hypothetical protein